jgi:hypothetical protein
MSISINEYRERVIALFKSGQATEEQWQEMAQAVLESSESGSGSTMLIDLAVDPDLLNEEQ